jgi:patatin-like phospholipase/acyl hydrolase
MGKYRILSLDGGGLRGLISARLLDRLSLERKIEGWLEKVDLVAGTSTGGILALGLAAGKSPGEICDLYIKKGPEIFDDSFWDDIRDLGKTIGADYSNRVLRKELKRIFGETKLGELHRKVAIPAFDLDNEASNPSERTWKPKIFHNYSGPDSDAGRLAADVALYTSAAPTYFPSADGFIDGGVFANNPSLVALAQAISLRNIPSERADIDEVILLSMGTGINLSYIRGRQINWGYAQWVKPLIHILMDGVSGISDYQAKQILDRRYHRVQMFFPSNEIIPMDAVQKIPRMEEIANSYDLSGARDWIASCWK